MWDELNTYDATATFHARSGNSGSRGIEGVEGMDRKLEAPKRYTRIAKSVGMVLAVLVGIAQVLFGLPACSSFPSGFAPFNCYDQCRRNYTQFQDQEACRRSCEPEPRKGSL